MTRFFPLLLGLAALVHAQVPDSTAVPQPSVATVPVIAASADTSHPASVAAVRADTAAVVPVAASMRDSSGAAVSVVPTSPAVVVPPTAPVVHHSALKRLPQVAILSFTGEGLAAKDLATVTNRFESELLATDSFKIVERRNIDKILKEQGFQQSGACDNSECSVEIGQLLSVQGIFTGELSKVGKTWSLSVKRTDVGSGQTEFSHVLDIQGSLEDVLRGGCAEMALIASGRKKPDNSHTVLVAQSSGHVWPWIVGGGVLVAGGVTAAILLTQDKSSSATTTSSRDVTLTFDTGK